MAKFNGHKNWNHWNVCMWINNNRWLRIMAMNYVRVSRTLKEAAEGMLSGLNDVGIFNTPDGAPYSKSSILSAIRGM